MSAKKYNLPIYILENGIADAKDQYRADFIREHLKDGPSGYPEWL